MKRGMSAAVAAGVLIGMTLGLSGCASGAKTASTGGGSGEPIAANSATLVVHGMSCPLCANNVDKQLKEVPGVRDVNVDMSTGQVKVGFKEGRHPSEAQLRKAVDGTGFSLKSISTP